MTIDTSKLPRGIRNCNPGNMRSASGPDFKTVLVDGFAKFETMQDGCTSLAWLLYHYYEVLGLRTLPQFIGRYAPSSENDVNLYIRFVGLRMAISPLKWATYDLALMMPWHAIDFMRAITANENGACPLGWNGTDEWISPSMWLKAVQNVAKWSIT